GEVDLQRSLQPPAGSEVGDIARVADADFLQGVAVNGQIGLRPRELSAKLVSFAVAPGLRDFLCGRWAALETQAPRRRLHRVILLGGQLNVNCPDLRQAEGPRSVLACGRVGGRDAGRKADDDAGQDREAAGNRDRPCENLSCHRAVSLSHLGYRNGPFASGAIDAGGGGQRTSGPAINSRHRPRRPSRAAGGQPLIGPAGSGKADTAQATSRAPRRPRPAPDRVAPHGSGRLPHPLAPPIQRVAGKRWYPPRIL